MKPLVLALTLVAALLAGCSADTLTGPAEEDRGLEPSKVCSVNVRLC